MPRVVRVLASLDQLPPTEGVVVSVYRRPTAGPAVGMALVDADADRVTSQHSGTEALLVLSSIASLPCCATPLLCLSPVLLTPSALRVLGTARHRADPVTTAPTHVMPR